MAVIPAIREPGTIMMVFDTSGSMDSTPSGGDPRPGERSRMQLAVEAFESALPALPDELNMGMFHFPSGSGCETMSSPVVPPGPLSTTRTAILSFLRTKRPAGNTPTRAALGAAYDFLASYETRGPKAVMLISDGAENCTSSNPFEVSTDFSPTYERVAAAAAAGIKTYSIGVSGAAHSYMSEIAIQGRTRRTDLCAGNNYMGSGNCEEVCTTPTNPFACLPGGPGIDPPDGPCCHYIAEGAAFATELADALRDISSRFLDTCVFGLPGGMRIDDPAYVNVRVVYDGATPPLLLRQSGDPSVNSWNFYDATYTSVIVQGPICEDLKMGRGAVQIALGCPTILI
jgi:hypothetical protein